MDADEQVTFEQLSDFHNAYVEAEILSLDDFELVDVREESGVIYRTYRDQRRTPLPDPTMKTFETLYGEVL
jgi:hypothetical protein